MYIATESQGGNGKPSAGLSNCRSYTLFQAQYNAWPQGSEINQTQWPIQYYCLSLQTSYTAEFIRFVLPVHSLGGSIFMSLLVQPYPQ